MRGVAAHFPLACDAYVIDLTYAGADGFFHGMQAVQNVHEDSVAVRSSPVRVFRAASRTIEAAKLCAGEVFFCAGVATFPGEGASILS